MDVTVTDSPPARRFEARAGDELAGFLDYERTDDLVVAKHTEVLPASRATASAASWRVPCSTTPAPAA